MEKNYLKANFINLKFSIAIFSLFFISLGTNAQVVKEFQQRTSTYSSSKKIYNIKGDFTMIGNTNLSLWSYGNNTNNSNNYMIFVDEDNDDSTDNSSAAVLEFSNENGADPNCSNIVFAGLYWSGRTDNSSTTNDKRKIKVKGPNNNEYQTFTANQNDILYPGPSNMYAAYAEVTDLVRSNGTGEYWVADMALTQGNGGATGYYGGWGMIVIYENSQMNWRDVTIFDGYAHVEGNTVANYQLPVSGFNTAQSGPVNMKMGIMAGEGDVGIAGDYFQIKKNNNNSWLSLSHDQNSTNNFFNSSIENNGTNRTPNLSNNTGIDISMFNIPNQGNSVIANNQTSTTFRYGSTQDTYSIFSIAMSVDAYIPEIEGITSLTEINSNTAGNPPYSVEPGEEISYKIELKNKGTENIEDVKVVVPVPYNVDYVNSSLNTNFYFSPTPSTNNVYFNPTLGATGSIVWEISELPLATNTNDVLADLAVSFKVTENCTILSNACPGYDVITFNGNISGRGAITGTTFENKDLIRGYETEGACLGEPITSPFEISVDASSFRAENCGNSDEARRFIYCNREEPIKISEINSGFPSGTRFYNESPVDINSEEYTINNPIPNTTGSTEYYAIIPGAEDCAIPFTIEITSISTVPDTENITYCLNEEANPLDATASNSNYDLYYYTSETDTTPEMQIIPSTSQAGEFTYYVAEGESASCISPNKAEIKVKVLGVPEVAAPQNLNPDACGTELIDKTIPEISSEFTLISNQLFEELGGSIPGDADIDAIEYRDEVVQSNPVIYNRVFKISYECGSFELTQQITLNDLRDSLNPEFTITQPTCENVAGKIEVISNNASSYSLDGENFQSSNIFTGLVPGNYVVYVQNETGCVSDASAQIKIEENLGTPGAPLAEVSQQPTCEDTTGTISVTTETGISYTLLDENQDPLTNSIANGTFSGLSAGKYFVEASNGDCEAVSEVLEIEENLGTPGVPLAEVSQQPTCQDTIGTISVTTETGISYTLLDKNQDPLTNSISNGTFSGLSAGKYFIQASNGDCEAISEVLEIEENLGTPNQPQANVSEQPTCENITGTISVTTETGISYILLDENQNPLTNSIANGTFSELSTGKYFVQASNGDCEAVSEVLEIEENLGTPGAPLAEVSQQPTCEDTTGTISVTTETGISYTLLDENQDPLTNSIANGTFSGLSAGKYFVQASNGDCEAISEVLEIEENLGTPGTPLTEVSQQPTCEDTTGTISVTTKTGISYSLLDENENPLTNSIANGTFAGLSTGKYFVQASNGDCEAISEVLEIEENLGTPNQPQANVSEQPTCENITGTISVTTETGISYILLDENQDPLTNSISNGTFSGLSAGKYFVQASNGDCEAVSEALEIIENKGAPIAPVITSITNTTCSLNNGIIEFEVIEDLTFILKDSQQNEYSHENGSFTDLASGVYYLVAKNNDCEAKTEVTIDAINDDQAPEIAQLSDISVNTDEGICGAMVSFEAPEATDNCGIESVVFTEGLEPGSEFPLGSTTVTYTATDNAGNTATSSFKVIVTDNEAPVITCIDNIVTNAAEGKDFAIVDFNDATATDNCEVSVTQTAGPVSGSEFPLGTTTITFEAEDKAGNVSECSFTITVNDAEAPSLECPENISQPNDADICGAIVSFETPTGFDNSGDVEVVQTGGLPSGSEFPVGISTIEFTATDAEGNTATCSFTIEITDDEAPEITQLNDISVNTDEGLCGAVINFDLPEATDNCGIESVILTEGLEPGSEFPLGSTTVTYTATDNAGNTATSSFNVIVTDNEAPVITCIDNIVANAAEGQDFAIVDFNDATATDNCEVTVTQTAGPVSGSEFPLGTTTITFEAEDKAGNVSECSFTITVKDSEAPSLECPENILQPNDADICGAIVSFETPTAFDNSGEVNVLQTGGLPSGSESPVGISTIEFTATDAEGNSATCNFTIEITDDQAPEISPLNDISVNTDQGICGAVVNFELPEASDNRGTESVILTEGLEPGSEFPLGSTTVTYTATDNVGNTATSSFNVIVTDNEAPVITCVDNIIVNAAEGKDFAIVDFNDATATDNCEVTVTQTAGPASGSEFPLGTTTITFEAEDKAGNVSECSFTVTVNDSEAPSLECTENISQPNDADTCGALVSFVTPTAFDNSDEVQVVQTSGLPSGSEFPVGISTIEFTATDAEGNTATCSFTIEITDDQAPEIAQLNDISVNTDKGICGAVVNFELPEATDNCGIESIIVTEGLEPGSEFPLGSTTVTYTATDNAGNTANSSFKVIVTDNEAPVIAAVETINISSDENTCGAMIEIVTPSATDNCSVGNVIGTRDDNQALDSEYPVGNTTITWTVTDDNGNEAEPVIQTITVTDNEAPIIADVDTINTTADADSCGAMIEITAPLASDNCSVGMVNGTRDDNQALNVEYPVGTTTITWTVTDENGNEAEPVLQTLTVTDNQAPVIECPENMIFSTESGVDFATVIFENPLASDNCEVNVEQTSGFTSGSQFPIGTNTVTFTATDTSGNTSQCSFDIIVEDTEDPTLECPSDIVRSTDSGICGAIVEFEIPEGFDNSGNVTVEQTEGLASGEVFPVGTTTITFTASDEAGNTVSCSFEITVVDDEAPVIEDKNDITLNTDPDLCGAIVDYELPSATDDCGLESIELTEGLVPGSEFPLGETRVTYTAIDVNGNSVNSSFTVTVIDNEAPVIACPEDIQLNVEFGTETVVVNYATISATDNCSETSIELIEGYASGEEFPLGKTIVTYEITDASGNTSSCSFAVIIEEEPEETPPAPTAPQVDLIQPDCVTPTGVILINTEDGLTYSIDGENYVAVEEFTELEPGTYQVTTKDEFDQISDATIVTLVGPIASEIETTTISLCIDDSTFDLFELLEGEYDTSGVWVDTEETGALTQGFIDPAILAIGTYTFEYQLNNGICDSTTEVTVSINDDCVVLPCSLEDIRSSISKAVTPNGDNRNDYFTIDFASDCGFTYDLMIFNRWGNKIYEATNYQNDWDGYSTNSATSSNQLPSGTYFYILEIRNSGFDPIQGYIYLGTK